jgi:hypothetical protein
VRSSLIEGTALARHKLLLRSSSRSGNRSHKRTCLRRNAHRLVTSASQTLLVAQGDHQLKVAAKRADAVAPELTRET